ncbi:16S rRNA (guanine(966)-N(2))-methyltransferase RsmD [Caldinitratiruptor microaerophilus]|uniref:16S rRNA (guanine(966)-N(2))-methyltransferase RsmD n=1 Tax=Caldinitratiruptor microaerophilus TaxID=671077 RepID=UPI00222EE047|nr:16S rRNA (guanine(966)-N(2))-methyltransferase RsmD [Caldinitratiruptor microaerophilus]
MRVIAGTARGIRLRTVRGLGARPTSDRVRETLFAILQPVLPDATFLDLYAGSGAVGIEALSRGARQALFVERHPGQVRVLVANLGATGLRERAEVWRREVSDALADLARQGRHFDVAFLDPPYGRDLVPATLPALVPVVEPGGLAVAEHHRRDRVPEAAGSLRRVRETTVGETVLSFYRREEQGGRPDGAHAGNAGEGLAE